MILTLPVSVALHDVGQLRLRMETIHTETLSVGAVLLLLTLLVRITLETLTDAKPNVDIEPV